MKLISPGTTCYLVLDDDLEMSHKIKFAYDELSIRKRVKLKGVQFPNTCT